MEETVPKLPWGAIAFERRKKGRERVFWVGGEDLNEGEQEDRSPMASRTSC